MRIALIDHCTTRVAVVEDGLREAGLLEFAVFSEWRGMIARIETFRPDVILVAMSNPQHSEFEEMFAVTRALARPVAMFVDHSNEAALEAAIDAGIAAYVVDGFAKLRIKPVLELAVRRFNAFSQLRDELEEAKSALAARNMLDAAKALLIKKRKIDEAAAYALLRKLAMDQGRKITDVAEALLTSEKILNGFE